MMLPGGSEFRRRWMGGWIGKIEARKMHISTPRERHIRGKEPCFTERGTVETRDGESRVTGRHGAKRKARTRFLGYLVRCVCVFWSDVTGCRNMCHVYILHIHLGARPKGIRGDDGGGGDHLPV